MKKNSDTVSPSLWELLYWKKLYIKSALLRTMITEEEKLFVKCTLSCNRIDTGIVFTDTSYLILFCCILGNINYGPFGTFIIINTMPGAMN